MRRRTALKLVAALSASLGALPARSNSQRRVLVVGAGIVGASIAYVSAFDCLLLISAKG